MRWIIIAILALYIVPVITFLILFCRYSVITDLVLSALSFLFYSPTYLNILNIYALCRINDISWGTKGLDASSSKNAQIESTWSIVRMIQVGKYIFWNIIASMLLLTLGSDYLTRFWITFIIMIILLITLFLKAFLGAIYMIKYRCSKLTKGLKDP